ncbi:MAG: hypothetical protein NTW98_00255, partial [Candidatus Nomurabacteria bacterium]|nr:hypothetical protein [Candidatus Nomurabacteria bacterium]
MTKFRVLDAVKVLFLSSVILVSFVFIGNNILSQNIIAVNQLQEAGVLSSVELPKTEERMEESDCNNSEISTKYNAFGNGSSDP